LEFVIGEESLAHVIFVEMGKMWRRDHQRRGLLIGKLKHTFEGREFAIDRAIGQTLRLAVSNIVEYVFRSDPASPEPAKRFAQVSHQFLGTLKSLSTIDPIVLKKEVGQLFKSRSFSHQRWDSALSNLSLSQSEERSGR